MSVEQATAFVDRLESDEDFAKAMEALRADPAAVRAAVAAAGFDATPEEIKTVFLSRFGGELSPEQLDAFAGGLSDDLVIAFNSIVIFLAPATNGAAAAAVF